MKQLLLRDLKHKKGPWQFLFYCWYIGAQKVIDDRKRYDRIVKTVRQKKNKPGKF